MSDKPLVFIDTNILLDFYRVRGSDAQLGLLQHIDGNHEVIITTSQIEMEFKKNRQNVILDSLRSLQAPNWGGLQVPAFLLDAQPALMLTKAKDKIGKQLNLVKRRVIRALRDPAHYDPVYRVLQRLFRAGCNYHLGRETAERRQVRRRALRRFLLGYPPRKQDDTSYGDATNWEWMVHCAEASGRNIVIVSRDSDYGAVVGDEVVLNDWLLHEFKDRVSQKRKIVLTSRLADGFKRASIRVTRAEEAEEKKVIEAQSTTDDFVTRYAQILRNTIAHSEPGTAQAWSAMLEQLLRLQPGERKQDA